MRIVGAILLVIGVALIFISWSLGALGWPPIGFEGALVLTMPIRLAGIALVGVGALIAVLDMSAPPKIHDDRHKTGRRG